MRQLRQTLRLHLEAHLSLRECARVLGISKTTVGAIVSMARVAGVDWALDEHNRSLITPEVEAAARKAKDEIAAGTLDVHDYMSDDKCPL